MIELEQEGVGIGKSGWKSYWDLMFELYGVLPICRTCIYDCKQYDAPGLIRFFCADRIAIKTRT